MQEFLKNHPEWPASKEKLQVYYSNFIINSETLSRHSHKLIFWEKIIGNATQEKLLSESEFTFDSKDLEEKFKIDNLKPLGFNTLLKEWKESRLLISENEYWSKSMLQKVWNYFQFFKSSDLVERERFIFVPCLESSIGKYYDKLGNDAMQVQDLQEIFNLSLKDVDLLVEFWTQKGILACLKLKDGLLIKKITLDSKEITVVDQGIINVKKTIKRLKNQIQDMFEKSRVLKMEIKGFMAQNKKIQALQTLKHLKVLESLLDKRHESMTNLETVLLKIESLNMDKELMNAYDSSSKVLEMVLKDSGLTIDSVQDTLDNLSDTLANVQQVQDAIQDFSQDSMDMEDVERELDELLLKDLECHQFPSTIGLQSLDNTIKETRDIKENEEAGKNVKDKIKARQAQLV